MRDGLMLIPSDITNNMEVALKLAACHRDLIPEDVWMEIIKALGAYQAWLEMHGEAGATRAPTEVKR